MRLMVSDGHHMYSQQVSWMLLLWGRPNTSIAHTTNTTANTRGSYYDGTHNGGTNNRGIDDATTHRGGQASRRDKCRW